MGSAADSGRRGDVQRVGVVWAGHQAGQDRTAEDAQSLPGRALDRWDRRRAREVRTLVEQFSDAQIRRQVERGGFRGFACHLHTEPEQADFGYAQLDLGGHGQRHALAAVRPRFHVRTVFLRRFVDGAFYRADLFERDPDVRGDKSEQLHARLEWRHEYVARDRAVKGRQFSSGFAVERRAFRQIDRLV